LRKQKHKWSNEPFEILKDNSSASSSADLSVAMSETAVTAQQAGVSMDTLIGYLATMEEVTQDSGESIGNSMKTILSRMTQVKNSALEDGTSLNDVAKSLKNVGISLTDDSGEFRSMSDVLGDVSEKWDSLSNVEQSNIATTIAGVRQKEKFLVLMENYSRAMELAGDAAESSGLSQARYGAYLDSVKGRQESMTAAAEKFVDTMLNSKFIGFIYTLAKKILDIATALNKVTGGTAGWTAALASLVAVVNLMTNNSLSKFVVTILKGIASADSMKVAMGVLKEALLGGKSSLEALTLAFKASPLFAPAMIIAGVVALAVVVDKLTVSYQEQKEKVQSLASEIDSLQQNINTLKEKENKTTKEEDYLKLLENELDLNKRIFDVEQKRLYQKDVETEGGTKSWLEKVGESFENIQGIDYERNTSLASNSGIGSAGDTTISSTDRATKAAKDLQDAYDKATKSAKDFNDALQPGSNKSDSELKKLGDTAKKDSEAYDKLTSSYDDYLSSVEAYGEENVNEEDRDVINAIKEKMEALNQVEQSTTRVKDSISEIDDQVSQAEDAFNSFGTVLSSFQNSISDVGTAYKEMASDGQLSFSTVMSLLEKNSDLLANLQVSADGTYTLSKESMESYFEEKKKDVIEELNLDIQKTQSAIDAANSIIKANDQIINSNHNVALSAIVAASGISAMAAQAQLAKSTATLKEENESSSKNVADLNAQLAKQKAQLAAVTKLNFSYVSGANAATSATKSGTSAVNEQTTALKKVQEAAQKYLDTLNDEKDKQDAIAKAIQKIIQKEIDALNDQKDALDDTYDARIDALKEQETALEEQENTEDKLLEIEKARNELQKAQSQRNVRRYEEGKGWVWTSDASTVSSAQEKLDDLEKSWKREQEKAAIESTIKALEAEKKAAEDNISAQIKTLQKLKDGWNEATDTTMTNLNKWTGALEYVTQFENGNYNTRISMMNSFTSNYIGLCNQIINAEKAVAQAKANAEAASNVSYSGGSYSGGGSSSGGSSTPVAAHIVSKRYTSWLYNGSHRDASGRTTYTYLRHVYYTWSDGHQSTSTESRSSTVRLTASQMSASYASGGVDTKGGEAILHGTPNHAEVIFNAAQGKALYNWVNNLANAERAGTINSTTNSKQSSIVINRLEVTAPNNATIDTIITSARQKIQTTR
jgi:hypothetical protein